MRCRGGHGRERAAGGDCCWRVLDEPAGALDSYQFAAQAEPAPSEARSTVVAPWASEASAWASASRTSRRASSAERDRGGPA
jgi:hypothetical protein